MNIKPLEAVQLLPSFVSTYNTNMMGIKPSQEGVMAQWM
jgi:hypothetical protein